MDDPGFELLSMVPPILRKHHTSHLVRGMMEMAAQQPSLYKAIMMWYNEPPLGVTHCQRQPAQVFQVWLRMRLL